MTRSITAGSGNTDTSNYPNPFIINVGASRTFTNIRDAVDSLLGLRFNQQIIIQVDDGTYDHYPVYLDNPNLSGRLTILGNLSSRYNVALNCIPDPLLNQRIKPGTQLGSHDTLHTLNNTSDFSNLSYGFIAADGFKLKLSGFSINGSFVDQVNVTHCGLMAVNSGSISCLEDTMAISGCMNGIAAIRFGKISANRISITDIQYTGVWAYYKSLVSVNASLFTGLGSSSTGTVLTMATMNGINTPSATYTGRPFILSDGSICYNSESAFDQFPIGAVVAWLGYTYADASFWTNISDSNGCLQVGPRSTAIVPSGTYANTTLPVISNNSYLSVPYSSFSGSILTPLLSYTDSFIDATGDLAGLTAAGRVPSTNGYTSNVTRADGSSMFYN